MKIGLFFGSFDPIHIGHLSIITSVLNDNLVDKIIVIPAYHNPFKKHDPAPFIKRWEMCYRATENIPNINCAQIERVLHDRLNLDKIPTYKVLDCLKSDPFFNNSDFYIITTPETLSEIPTWEKGMEIIQDNNFILIQGDPNIGLHLINKIRTLGNEIICRSLEFINISSTKVRNMIKDNKILSPYVPEELQLIIEKNNLYK